MEIARTNARSSSVQREDVSGDEDKDMSQTFSQSMPLDASLPGTAGSRLLDSMRGILRLFWIEFRRCGGYWMLPLILPLVWFMNQGRDSYGVVLWYRMSIVTFQSYIVIAPLTAGLAAFLAGRDRRRRTDGLIETAPIQLFHRDLVLIGASAGWGLVAYALVGIWFMGQGVLFATWGGPDLGWLAVGALAIVLHAAIGFLIGRVIRGRFAALVAIALPIGLAIGADAYHRVTEFDMGNGMGMGTTYEQPLRELSPFSLSMSLSFNDDGIVSFVDTYIRDSLLWLAGLLGMSLAAIALVRHRRSLVGMAGLGVSMVVATLGANALLDVHVLDEIVESRIQPFEWSCQSAAGVQVCLHPAYEARLDDVTERMGYLVAPVAGLPSVPTMWYQSLPTERVDKEDDGVGRLYDASVDHALVFSMADEIFSAEYGDRNATQLVVVTALAEQAGIVDPFPWPYGFPSEVTTTQGEGFYGPDDAELAAFEPKFEAAVDRFLALSPEEQRAWLEANWDALRAGELMLDDMP